MTEAPIAAPPAPQAAPPEPPQPTPPAPPSAEAPEPKGHTAEALLDALRNQGYTDEQIDAMVAGEPPPLPTTPTSSLPAETEPSTPSTGIPQANEPAPAPPANEDGAGGSPEAPAPSGAQAGQTDPSAQVEPPAPEPPVQRGVGTMRSAAPSASAPLTPGQQRRAFIEGHKSYL